MGYIAGTPYVATEVSMKAGPGGKRGLFTAWNPVQNKKAWDSKEEFPVWRGALVTAGGIAFFGTMDRWFKAVDARTGEDLWRFRTGSGVIGPPINCKGPEGKQFVAIMDGASGLTGAVVSGQLDPNVPYGALGFVGAMQDLPRYTGPGGTLYVFALPGKAP